jgi:anti-sigma regulatory factor (Ser/Thr protein kinase)
MTKKARNFSVDEAPRAEMRRLVEEGTAGSGLGSEVIEDLLLAVWEACALATSHSGNPEVEVSITRGPHAVEFEVRNAGVYRPEGTTEETTPDDRLGVALTMAISMSMVDEVHVDPGTEENRATLIRMVKLTGE